MRLPDRLPSLQGALGAAVLSAYAVLVAVVAAITLLAAWATGADRLYALPMTVHYGLRLDNDDSRRPLIGGVQGQAKTAGVRAGDRLAAVNGVPLAPGATSTEAAALFARATGPLSITTRSETGGIRTYVLPRTENLEGLRDPRSSLPLPVTAALGVLNPLVGALILISISLLLARNRPRDPEAMLLAFGFLLLAYGVGDDLWLWRLHPEVSPDMADWIEQLLAVLGYWAMFVGFCAFPDGRFPNLWARLAWLVPTTYVIVNASYGFHLLSGALASAVDIPIFVIVVVPVLLRYRAARPGVERQQIKWALFGGAIMIVGAFARFVTQNDVVAPHLQPAQAYLLDLIDNDVDFLAFPLCLLISLLRYRLYDVDTVITRSAAYTVLAVALLAVFTCTEKVIELLGEEYFGQRLGALAGGLGAAAAAVMVAPLHHRITHWVEHRFRHDLLHLRQNLPPLMSALRETASPADLAKAALHQVLHAVHGVAGALLGQDGAILAAHGLSSDELAATPERWTRFPKSGVHVDPGDVLLPVHIPLRVEGASPAGLLLLGPRPDGSLYGKDERETLAQVAGPVAHSLTVAVRRKTMTEVEERRYAEILGRLEVVEQAVSRLHKSSAKTDLS